MLVQIPQLLSADQVAHIRGQLAATNWVDGKATAGSQSAGAKNNLQVPEDAIAQANLPMDRVMLRRYASGHMLYLGDTAEAFADDVRTLIRDATR